MLVHAATKMPRRGPAESPGNATPFAEEIGLEMTGSTVDTSSDSSKAQAGQKRMSPSSAGRGGASLSGILSCKAMARPTPLTVILAAGSVVLALSMGTRHVFGVFLAPLSKARGPPLHLLGDCLMACSSLALLAGPCLVDVPWLNWVYSIRAGAGMGPRGVCACGGCAQSGVGSGAAASGGLSRSLRSRLCHRPR